MADARREGAQSGFAAAKLQQQKHDGIDDQQGDWSHQVDIFVL